MTRINTIDPSLLTNEHLIAELRELPRIPNNIASGKAKVDMKSIPLSYVLGAGHVKFFYNKLAYLAKRHTLLREEYKSRTGKDFSIEIDWSWVTTNLVYASLFKDWVPGLDDHKKNIDRIKERILLRKRAYNFNGVKIDDERSVDLYFAELDKNH